jgi:hypothetical protein
MQSPSGLAASPALIASRANQRVHYRHQIHSLVYVTLDEGNGGIVRNLSQNGAAIQAVGALRPNQAIRMRFDLLRPKTRVDVRAEVAWATPTGQAGVRFVDLSPQTVGQVNDWIFSNLLRGIEQASPVLASPDEHDDLILSPSARPAIRLPRPVRSEVLADQATEGSLALSWWPNPISCRTLAGLMDGLVLFSAVLTFFCVFLGIAKALPTWPVFLGLLFGVSGFFTALYWCLFAVMGRGTPGVVLARNAIRGNRLEEKLRDSQARFR